MKTIALWFLVQNFTWLGHAQTQEFGVFLSGNECLERMQRTHIFVGNDGHVGPGALSCKRVEVRIDLESSALTNQQKVDGE